MNRWNQVRLLVLAALLAPSAYLVGSNLGYRDGIAAQIGGPGRFTTSLIEWQDFTKRKVVVYLNDGANGYSFWMTLNPGFYHYTAAAKVFTCDNTNRQSIRDCMEMSRAWARDDWEGAETRIVGGRVKAAGEDDDLVDQRRAERDEELEILRNDVNRQALKIEILERKLAEAKK